ATATSAWPRASWKWCRGRWCVRAIAPNAYWKRTTSACNPLQINVGARLRATGLGPWRTSRPVARRRAPTSVGWMKPARSTRLQALGGLGDGTEQGAALVHGLFPLRGRVRIVHDAGTGLDV